MRAIGINDHIAGCERSDASSDVAHGTLPGIRECPELEGRRYSVRAKDRFAVLKSGANAGFQRIYHRDPRRP